MKNKLAWLLLLTLVGIRVSNPDLTLVFKTDSSNDDIILEPTSTDYNFIKNSNENKVPDADSLLIELPEEHELFKVVGISPDIKYELFDNSSERWENQENSELNNHY